MTTISVIGSHRGWTEEGIEAARKKIDNILFNWYVDGNSRFVSGGAVGPDSWGADAAHREGYEVKEYLPDRERYGWPRAAFIRNIEIAEDADVLFAFYSTDEISPGTKSTIKHALSLGKLCYDWHPGDVFVRPVLSDECHREYDYHVPEPMMHKNCVLR